MGAESAGASAPRGHLGAFEGIRASLCLTCPQDEKLSSDSAGHKSPLRTSVPNWTRDLCLCVSSFHIVVCDSMLSPSQKAFPLIFDHTDNERAVLQL